MWQALAERVHDCVCLHLPGLLAGVLLLLLLLLLSLLLCTHVLPMCYLPDELGIRSKETYYMGKRDLIYG